MLPAQWFRKKTPCWVFLNVCLIQCWKEILEEVCWVVFCFCFFWGGRYLKIAFGCFCSACREDGWNTFMSINSSHSESGNTANQRANQQNVHRAPDNTYPMNTWYLHSLQCIWDPHASHELPLWVHLKVYFSVLSCIQMRDSLQLDFDV